MDHNEQEQVALHRWAVIAEAANGKLTARERGALVRQVAARPHAHPDGSSRTYSRVTIDRWLRAWREGGLDALKPAERSDTGTVRAHPELFAEASALRLELPGRSAAQIASILYHRHGIKISERTVRGQLRRAGGDALTRVKLADCGKSPAGELLASLASALGSAAAASPAADAGCVFVFAEHDPAGFSRWPSPASSLPRGRKAEAPAVLVSR